MAAQCSTRPVHCLAAPALAADDTHRAFIDSQIAANGGKSGVYVLDTGTEALLARAGWRITPSSPSKSSISFGVPTTSAFWLPKRYCALRSAECAGE